MLNPLLPLKFLPDSNMQANRGYNQTTAPLKERPWLIKRYTLDLCQVVTQVMLWILSIKHFNGILLLQIYHTKINLKIEEDY